MDYRQGCNGIVVGNRGGVGRVYGVGRSRRRTVFTDGKQGGTRNFSRGALDRVVGQWRGRVDHQARQRRGFVGISQRRGFFGFRQRRRFICHFVSLGCGTQNTAYLGSFQLTPNQQPTSGRDNQMSEV